MFLLDMINGARIHKFYKKVKQRKFLSFKLSFEIWDLLSGWQLATNSNLQHNISIIMPTRPKKVVHMGCEYQYNIISSVVNYH